MANAARNQPPVRERTTEFEPVIRLDTAGGITQLNTQLANLYFQLSELRARIYSLENPKGV